MLLEHELDRFGKAKDNIQSRPGLRFRISRVYLFSIAQGSDKPQPQENASFANYFNLRSLPVCLCGVLCAARCAGSGARLLQEHIP